MKKLRDKIQHREIASKPPAVRIGAPALAPTPTAAHDSQQPLARFRADRPLARSLHSHSALLPRPLPGPQEAIKALGGLGGGTVRLGKEWTWNGVFRDEVMDDARQFNVRLWGPLALNALVMQGTTEG